MWWGYQPEGPDCDPGLSYPLQEFPSLQLSSIFFPDPHNLYIYLNKIQYGQLILKFIKQINCLFWTATLNKILKFVPERK